ncbi:MAG: hypothetical protein KJZ96_13835, partial [Rhodocyclaceae bacterium]|nr:hypothetical protein [Rhodocyclaceae bacterium]
DALNTFFNGKRIMLDAPCDQWSSMQKAGSRPGLEPDPGLVVGRHDESAHAATTTRVLRNAAEAPSGGAGFHHETPPVDTTAGLLLPTVASNSRGSIVMEKRK